MDEIEVIGVSFAEEPIDDGAGVGIIPLDDADIHPDPAFRGPSSDPLDLPVIELGPAPVAITPAQVPTLNQIGAMARKNGLCDPQFTAVGYGAEERTHEPGSGKPQFGDGGTCYGDSGGPNFLGAGATETNVAAAVTVTGDSVCRATNVVYRLDSASAQAFLDAFGLGGPAAATAAKVGKASATADRGPRERDGGKRHRHGGKHHRGRR
jgi:hypothetical protein